MHLVSLQIVQTRLQLTLFDLLTWRVVCSTDLIGDVSYETYKAKKQGPTPLEAANFSEPARLGLCAFHGILLLSWLARARVLIVSPS